MRSIIEDKNEKSCFVCGYVGKTEEHHIFGGNPNRDLSEKNGMEVHLCYMHHRDSKEGVHFNLELMKELHRIGQRAFEKNHSREEFMRIFGKNYLDDSEIKAEEKTLDGFIWLCEPGKEAIDKNDLV